MDTLAGKLLTVYLLATLAACAFGWLLGVRYRRALVRLMSAPASGTAAPAAAGDAGIATTLGVAQATAALPSGPAPALPSRTRWRRAETRLIVALVLLSLAIALTRSVILHVQALDGPLAPGRVLTMWAVVAWPVLVAVGALRRWSQARLALALLAWYAAAVLLALARSIEWRPLQTMVGIAWMMAPALALLALHARRVRAAAPWLWPPLALLALAALAGLDALAWLVETRSPLLMQAPDWVSAPLVMLLFPLAGIALAWWPVSRFARGLARAYERRRVSELLVLFSAAWVLTLAFDAIGNHPAVLLPLLWIVLAWGAALVWQRRRDHRERAPTLLVLRVFKQDVNVTALFDDVVERWRVVGNTVLIAGTDLVDHTLDAADLFDFLDGRLAQRFVHSAADVPRRLAAFDWSPDADGRFRVNECYCHDSGWQVALAALVQRADVVLMDLRGFQAHNAGCRFELGVLARAATLQRVVVLTDAGTDRAVARADAAAAPAGRFAWIEVPAGFSRRETARRVRAALAVGSDRSPRPTRPAPLPS